MQSTLPVPLHARNGAIVETHSGLVQVRVKLSGITPLLINALSEDQLLAIRDKIKKPKNAAKPTPREEADSKVYRLKDGNPHIPVRMLMSNFIAAGQFVRLDGKRQISTADKTILPGMLTILSHEAPILGPRTAAKRSASSGPGSMTGGWKSRSKWINSRCP